MSTEALALALSASILFAVSTLAFKKFATEVSPLWMNAFKCGVATFAFLIAALVIGGPAALVPSLPVALGLLVSGFLGLNVGDLFLMRSFRAIGSGRTLMIFSFNPLFLSVASWFAFGEVMRPSMLVGVAILSLCLVLLGLETFRRERTWKASGYAQALLAVVLDAAGVMLTKWAFGVEPGLTVAGANFVRSLGALAGFFVLSRYIPIFVRARFLALPTRSRALVIGVSVTGTFLSLFMWIAAIRLGPVGAVAALGALGPLVATAVETTLERRAPSWQLVLASALFVAGVLVINLL